LRAPPWRWKWPAIPLSTRAPGSYYQDGDARAGFGIAGLLTGLAGLTVLLKFINPILTGAVQAADGIRRRGAHWQPAGA
jgi:hypothetical protein